jgi:hypothetical protein
LVFGYLAVRRGKDMNWDLMAYHYYQGHALLHSRLDYDYTPVGCQGFFNPVFDVPFFCLVRWLPPRAVGFLLGAVHGLNFCLLLGVALTALGGGISPGRRGAALLALVCAAVGMDGPMVVSELGTTFNDLLASLFVLGALLLLLRRCREGWGWGSALAAGAVYGFGLGGKLTAAFFLPALVIVAALPGPSWWARLKGMAAFLVACAAGTLASAGYWMALLYRHFQNPVFPYFNALFRSPYYPAENLGSDNRFGPRSFWEGLTFPYRACRDFTLTAEIFYRDWRFLIAFALLGVALLRLVAIRRRPAAPHAEPARRGLLGPALLVFFLSYLVWLKQFGIERYAVALEMLAPLVIVLLWLWIVPRRTAALAAALACLGVIVVTTRPAKWERESWHRRDYFQVEVPPLPADDSSLVILAGPCDRMGVLMPFFPKHTRFAGYAWHFSPRCDAEIERIVDEHPGDIYVLSWSLSAPETAADLKRLGLTFDRETLRTLCADVGKYSWCKATRAGSETARALAATPGEGR